MIPPPPCAVGLARPACSRTLTDGAGDPLKVVAGRGLRSTRALGTVQQLDGEYFGSVLRLMLRAPDAVEAVLSGRCPEALWWGGATRRARLSKR
jgi:hypothetical protein